MAILWAYRDQEVDKNKISIIVNHDIPNSAPDQQVRHLKRDGWELGSKSGKHCLNPYKPSQEFQNKHARKKKKPGATSFEELKASFGYRCVTCGAREEQPDPRYGNDLVMLQQGHMDLHGAGDSMANIIPQYQFCNRAYRDNFVFDDKGRARAVASIGPVKKARKAVQKIILEWLNNKHKEGKL